MLATLVLASFTSGLLGWLMGFLSVFLILLVLVQRGRGGGLTGALGGPGGQSAFGSKAGDTFTVITVVVASVWGFVCAFSMWLLGTHTPRTAVTGSEFRSAPADQRDAGDETTRSLPSDSIEGLFGREGLDLDADRPADEADSSVELTPADGTVSDGEEPESRVEDPTDEPPASNQTPE